MSRNQIPSRPGAIFRPIGATLLVSLLCVVSALAQDAIRPSLAGEAAAEARRQSLDSIPYNLLAGPLRFRFSVTAGIEYNDNVNVAEINSQEDFIFRPQANLNVLWPVTQLNTLRLDLGVGYAFYLDHNEYNTNSLLVAPASQLSFDIFVGDVRINFHDRFSVEQDPIGEPGLNNVADYGRFQNTGGVSLLWDMNMAVLTLGYDHYNFIATNNDFEYLDRNAEILLGSLSFAVNSTTSIGAEGSVIWNDYDQNFLNDSDTYNVGGFLETQVTGYLKLRLAAGYQMIDFDNNSFVTSPIPGFGGGGFPVFADSASLDDFYINLLISHRINAAITQRLSAGHESQLGVNSNYVKLNFVRHTVNWNIINRTLLSTEFFYEDAEDSGGFINEHFQRYGGALSLGYQLTRHVTLGARYQYTQKNSDAVLRDYQQNRVSLDGTYSF